ncbi:MAG: nucleotidyltransferase domain-containing protein [Candidatus Margulisiibacteriota bacterium]
MLSRKDIIEIVQTIKRKTNPKLIYLFGSYSSGRQTETSDLDILVIDDSNGDKNSLALEISKTLFPRNYGLDLIVVSPEDIKKKQMQNLGFWQNIVKTGEKVYERN